MVWLRSTSSPRAAGAVDGCLVARARLGSAHAARPAVRLFDDLEVREADVADEREPEVPHEQLADLRLGELARRQVEPERLGMQRASVHEGDVGVEVGSVLGHSESSAMVGVGVGRRVASGARAGALCATARSVDASRVAAATGAGAGQRGAAPEARHPPLRARDASPAPAARS